MYSIIVGCGRVGSQLATMLSVEGHEVAVVDKNPEAFKRLGSAFEGLTIRGVGFDERVLRDAGAERADSLAAVTDLDNTNLMTAEVASSIFEIPKVIARLFHPDKEETYKKLNLDYILGTRLIAQKFFEKFFESRVVLQLPIDPETNVIEFKIGQKAAGKKVGELEIPHLFKIFTTSRNGQSIIVDENTELKLDDRVIAVAKRQIIVKRKWIWEK
jgi:trk system potassium uptake protein TrkA